MTNTSLRLFRVGWELIATTLCAFLIVAAQGGQQPAVAANPLNKLIGSWGGSGSFKLSDGRTERIRCNAYYTGGGSQLRMAVRCRGGENKIEIRSRLSHNAGRLSGSWEERTYNAEGTASGTVSGQTLRLNISGGGLFGSMRVSFSRTRQTISVSVRGVGLKSVRVTLRRR